MNIFVESLNFSAVTSSTLQKIEDPEQRKQLEWALEIAKDTAFVAPQGLTCGYMLNTRHGFMRPCPRPARWIVHGRSRCECHAGGEHGATFREKRLRKGQRYSRPWNRDVEQVLADEQDKRLINQVIKS